MPDDQVIELSSGGTGRDVIETSTRSAAIGRLIGAARRWPVASAIAVFTAGALVFASVQLARRPAAEPLADAATHTPTSVATAPPRLTATAGAPSPTASATPPVVRLAEVGTPPVDTLVGNELRTKDGQLFSLGWAGQFVSVAVAPGGWFVAGEGTVWFLRSDGVTTPMLWQIQTFIIGPGGERVAWTKNGRALAARFVNGSLTAIRETASQEYLPIWFLGDAVVMHLPIGGDPTPQTFDLWRPSLGAFKPRPDNTAAYLWGPNADGTALMGVERAADDSGRGCVVELNPQTNAVARRACVLPRVDYGPHTVSPDGRWLMLLMSEGGAEGAIYRIDLRTIFTQAPKIDSWPANLDLGGVWIDESTYVTGGNGVLRRISMATPRQVIEIPLSEVPPDATGEPAYIVPAHEVYH